MTPVPGTGDDMVALADELREFTAMKYMGDCKCGKCQLVPRAFIDKLYAALSAPPASRIEQEGGMREALEQIDTIAVCTGVVDPKQHANMLANIARIARAALAAKTTAGAEALPDTPKPETLRAYASILEKPQYNIKNGIRYKIPTGEVIEAACAALRFCASLSPASGRDR